MAQQRNEYDIMKKMISNMKAGALLGRNQMNEGINTNNLSPAEEEDEQTKFKETIEGVIVQFGKFSINRISKTVEWSGFFITEKIGWNYSLDSSKGCYVVSTGAQLSPETLETLQKLQAYYEIWAQYWANEIS